MWFTLSSNLDIFVNGFVNYDARIGKTHTPMSRIGYIDPCALVTLPSLLQLNNKTFIYASVVVSLICVCCLRVTISFSSHVAATSVFVSYHPVLTRSVKYSHLSLSFTAQKMK